MAAFEFATAARIIFGAGSSRQAAALATGIGRRILLVSGSDRTRTAWLEAALTAAGADLATFTISGEPTVDGIGAGIELARGHGSQVVVACGGGSVIDAGKALAALAPNAGDILDYLEVIGRAQPLAAAPLPAIAIPTTAGTGAEVTRNAVLKSTSHGVKVSLRDYRMLPAFALIDPDLTATLPPSVIASTGLDALTQCLEPFISCKANAMTDLFCRDGLARAARSLRAMYADAGNAAAREDMAMASLCGGLALANAGLGAVHGFAGPLGGMTEAPHGLICARLLPLVLAANLRAVKNSGHAPTMDRLRQLGPLLTGHDTAAAEDACTWIQELCQDLQVPGLATYGLRVDMIPEAVAASARASSMKGNPVPLSESELHEILLQSL